MLRSGLIAKECRSAPLYFRTDQDHPDTRCALNQFIVIHIWLHSTNESTERNGADAGPAPFRFTNGAGPTPAPFLRFGVDSYFQDSIMTIEDHNGVDRVDRKAQWPHFLNKETRFCFVAQLVTNMRWGRRCWDCPQVLSRRCCVTLRSSCAGTPALHPVCTSRFRAESTSLAMSARSRTDRECAVYCLRTRPSATSTPNPRARGDAVATALCRAKSKPGVNLCGFVVGFYRTDQSANEISECITSRGRPGPNIT